eukprot:3078435-Pyramimonas_sp.AAC.1
MMIPNEPETHNNGRHMAVTTRASLCQRYLRLGGPRGCPKLMYSSFPVDIRIGAMSNEIVSLRCLRVSGW